MKLTNRSKTSTSYYIFVAADSDRHRLNMPSAFELASYRLSRKEWGLRSGTSNRTNIKVGDMVLVYISGRRQNSQTFIAQAEILGGPIPNRGSKTDSPIESASIFSEYKVSLTKIKIFKTPLKIHKLIRKLSFIKPERVLMWRIYFQGGTIRIPEKDFLYLVSAAH